MTGLFRLRLHEEELREGENKNVLIKTFLNIYKANSHTFTPQKIDRNFINRCEIFAKQFSRTKIIMSPSI